MAKKNIGATLSIKDSNFTTGIKKAITGTQDLKKHTANATGSLKNMGSQSSSTGEKLSSLAKKVVGVVAAYTSIKQAVSFAKDCIELANVQASAEARLESTMMNVKGTTLQQVDAMKSYASQLQKTTTIGDEVTIQGMSQLATFNLQSDTIKKLTPAMQNLAVAQYGTAVSGEQMQQVANLVGKVMAGNTSSLSRYGITLDETQKKIISNGTQSQRAAILTEVFSQKYGNLAEAMANTPEGRIQQLKNAWGDMQEVIGAKLYPVVTEVLGVINTAVPKIQTVMVSAIDAVSAPLVKIKDAVLPALITSFKAVWDYGVSAFNNIRNAISQNSGSLSGINGIVTGVGANLKNAFELCKPALDWLKDTGLPLVVTGISNVLNIASGVYSFFVNNWSAIAPIIAGIAGAILVYKAAVTAVNIVQKAWSVIQGICTAAQWAFNVALSANPIGIIIVAIGALIAIGMALWMNWDSVCEWCKNAFGAVKDFFVSVGTSIGSFFVGLWTGIKNTAVSVWTGITSFLSNAWNTVASGAKSIFTGIANAISNVWNGIVNTIKGAINRIISGINSMIRGAVNGINGLINGINKVTGAVGIPSIPTFTAPQIPMLAKGGITRTAGSVIVGEKGAEMLTLPKGAQVTPLNHTTNKSNNVFNINIYADGRSVESVINELVPKLKLALANL